MPAGPPLPQSLDTPSGPFPAVVPNDGAVADHAGLLAWLAGQRDVLEGHLRRDGAVLLRGFPVATAEQFDAVTGVFGYPVFTYDGSLSNAVRVNLTPRVFTANEAPPDVEIHLHHEMAQTPVSPETLFMCCLQAAATGGATPLCRSDLLFAALAAAHPALAAEFAERGLRYTTVMPAADDARSGQGRSWQHTLGVAGRDAAEARLAALSYTWAWQDDGALRAVTPRLDAVRPHADGTPVFHNQLLAAYLGWPGVREDPARALAWGDGGAIPVSALEAVAALAPACTVDLAWQDGDVALVDNRRCMHGRRPYSGARKRVVLVSLAAAA